MLNVQMQQMPALGLPRRRKVLGNGTGQGQEPLQVMPGVHRGGTWVVRGFHTRLHAHLHLCRQNPAKAQGLLPTRAQVFFLPTGNSRGHRSDWRSLRMFTAVLFMLRARTTAAETAKRQKRENTLLSSSRGLLVQP